ncbi:MAG: hypothetical protein AAGA42_22415, partial [Actinomycetota bacterium]
PKPLLDRINPSVDALLEHVEERTDLVRPEPDISEEQLERAQIELEEEHGEDEGSGEEEGSGEGDESGDDADGGEDG